LIGGFTKEKRYAGRPVDNIIMSRAAMKKDLFLSVRGE